MKQRQKQAKDQGYTLIELLVTVTIIAVILTAMVSAFFSTIAGGDRAQVGMLVKQEGDHALTYMASSIRNAESLTACDASSLTMRNQDEQTETIFSYDGVKKKILVTQQTIGTPGTASSLTSDNIVVTNFSLTCTDATANVVRGREVTISFTGAGTGSKANVSQQFATTVSLRN